MVVVEGRGASHASTQTRGPLNRHGRTSLDSSLFYLFIFLPSAHHHRRNHYGSSSRYPLQVRSGLAPTRRRAPSSASRTCSLGSSSDSRVRSMT